jgi:hypothetical protein
MIKLVGKLRTLKKLQWIVLSLNFFIYILYYPSEAYLLKVLLAVTTLVSILFTVPFLKGITLYLSIFFLVFGFTLQLVNGFSIASLTHALSNISNIVAFIGLIPILAIPMKLLNQQDQQISEGTPIEYSSRQLFNKGQSLSFNMASFMNMGALPMTWAYFEDYLTLHKNEETKKIATVSITRGFALAMLWSPIGAGVAIVADITNVSVLTLVPITLTVAILAIYVSKVLNIFALKTISVTNIQRKSNQNRENFSFTLILVPLLLFVILSVVLNSIYNLGMLYMIAATSIPFSFIWSTFLKKSYLYWSTLQTHFKDRIPSMYSQFGILYSAGFFVRSLENGPFLNPLYSFFSIIMNQWGEGFVLIIGMATVIILSVCGVHQFVAVTLIGVILSPIELGISPKIYAVGMLTSLSIGIMISPFNGTTALMSSLAGKDSFIIVKWNLLFAVILFLLVSIFLLVVLQFL